MVLQYDTIGKIWWHFSQIRDRTWSGVGIVASVLGDEPWSGNHVDHCFVRGVYDDPVSAWSWTYALNNSADIFTYENMSLIKFYVCMCYVLIKLLFMKQTFDQSS